MFSPVLSIHEITGWEPLTWSVNNTCSDAGHRFKFSLRVIPTQVSYVSIKINLSSIKRKNPRDMWWIYMVNIGLYTWTSPDGQDWNQIDYILCSQRWRSSIQTAKTRPGADCSSDHELLIAKLRLKLKKVGKTTRPFRYDLNQIPYDYIVEVRNRSKGLDLIDRVPDELWMEVRDIVQETGIKTILMEKKCKKAKWLSGEAFQIAVKRREVKSKGEKGKIQAFECRVPKNSKERKESLPQWSMQRNRWIQQNGKD